MPARRWLFIVAVAIGLGSASFTPRAYAGIPVIDVANLMQAIEQVIAWAKQYQQIERDYRQQVRQYESITGSRNLGDILNNPTLRASVPTELVTLYDAVRFGNLTGAGAAIRAARRKYDCDERVGEDQRTCRAVLNQSAHTSSLLNEAYEVITRRIENIESLQQRINSTDDLKAVGELSARISAEGAQVANDQNRIALLKGIAEQERVMAEQERHEMALHNSSLEDDGVGRMLGFGSGLRR